MDHHQRVTVGNTEKLIDVGSALAHFPARSLLALLAGPIERALSLKHLNDHYTTYSRQLERCDADGHHAFQVALDVLNVKLRIDERDLDNIPSKGPLLVVANHPFGGIEGVLLGRILLQARPDLRILANYLLKRIAGIGDVIIPVDPFEEHRSKVANLRGIKEAVGWLKDGGVLATFPAGEVASFRPPRRGITDKLWSHHIGGLVRRTKAAVLPVYFPGRNSLWFQFFGMLHPRIRTALLPRELMNKSGRTLSAYIGRPIPWQKLRRFDNNADLVHFLRLNTFILKNRGKHPRKRFADVAFPRSTDRPKMPIIPPVDTALLEKDIRQLSDEQVLVANGDLTVYIARSEQIPNVLTEIGRLREITFREVDEGTGDSVDLDKFDTFYRHLFLWNRRRKELVGAYRLGLTDQILAQHGAKGLYTSQLFKYKPEFVRKLTHAIEFGRSFIRSEYQKKFNSLMLLWKGIGEFVARNPEYFILFGAVSISKDYHQVSKNLIVRFLRERKFHNSLSRLVSARRPYRSRRLAGISKRLLRISIQDIDDVSLLVSEIEKDGKGIPILLRQYLKLNGSLLCFNVDREFSDVVDGLLLVDLHETEPRLMKRFMGEEGFLRFVRLHNLDPVNGGRLKSDAVDTREDTRRRA